MANSCNNLALLRASVASGPEKRADHTPGKPPKASTFNPESSEITIFPVNFEIVSALSRAFSSKVIPVSSTSGKSG